MSASGTRGDTVGALAEYSSVAGCTSPADVSA